MTQINEEIEKAYAKYEAGQGATYRSQKEVFFAGAKSRDAEVERLRKDLDDALDLKAGNGPTALSRVVQERDALKKQVETQQQTLQVLYDEFPEVREAFKQASHITDKQI